jgi:hypothetical protein
MTILFLDSKTPNQSEASNTAVQANANNSNANADYSTKEALMKKKETATYETKPGMCTHNHSTVATLNQCSCRA